MATILGYGTDVIDDNDDDDDEVKMPPPEYVITKWKSDCGM